MVSKAKEAGVPQERIAVMMGYFLAAPAGEFARFKSTLKRILGRERQSMFSVMSKALL
jgi:hypothetical protein